jgi:carboxylesterase type B
MQNPLIEYDRYSDDEKIPKSNTSNKTAYWKLLFIVLVIVVALTLTIFYSGDDFKDHTPNHESIFVPVVTTNAGDVVGFSYIYSDPCSSGKDTEILAWRGIPFADPPVGNLRWKFPHKPNPWVTHLQANKFAPCCMQQSLSSGEVIGSEDCLYLNVYTKRNTNLDYTSSGSGSGSGANGNENNMTSVDDGLFPVLFFIYGGGLTNGAANASFDSLIASFSDDISEGQKNAGLTVVEVSYRLNAFGFLATSELTAESNTSSSGNYGIADQILALHWIQDNIVHFGGDKNKVTIAGQSSGGTSVFALFAADKNKTADLFSGGISMSGSPNITMSLKTAEIQNRNFTAGCVSGNHNNTETLRCMRSLSAEDILDRVPSSWSLPGIWSLPSSQSGQHYVGLAIVDGDIIKSSFSDLGSDQPINTPLMLGNMACEADEGPEMVINNYTISQWNGLLNNTFGQWSYNSTDLNGNTTTNGNDNNNNNNNSNINITTFGLEIANKMAVLYSSDANINPQKAYDSIVTDYGLYCGQIQLLKKWKSNLNNTDTNTNKDNNWNDGYNKFKANVFIYEDRWALSEPYISPWTGSEVNYTFHDTFYFMVTGQWSLIADGTIKYVPSESDLRGQRLLQSTWRSFIRNSSRSEIIVDGGSNWYPANADIGFNYFEPLGTNIYSNYSIYVIQSNASIPSATVVNHKRDKCSYYNTIGLDRQQYWWVN